MKYHITRRAMLTRMKSFGFIIGSIIVLPRKTFSFWRMTNKKKFVGLEPDPKGIVHVPIEETTYTNLKTVGGVVKVAIKGEKKPLIVTRTGDNSATAVSSRCTHLGCEVDLPMDGTITCSCHGSKFNTKGAVIHGPAKEPLHVFITRLEGNEILIDTAAHNG